MPAWLYEYGRALGSFLLISLTCFLLGVALVPTAYGVHYVLDTWGWVAAIVSLPFGFFTWGFVYAVIVIILKYASFSKFKPGTYGFDSWTTVRWVAIQFLALVCNEIFMRWLIGSPFLNWWFKGLGSKIGRRVVINTIIFSDWDMITIDDDVFVGGRATVIGHVGESGQLKFAPVHLGKKVSIGQESAIFPGVKIGDGSVVGAQSLVPKFTEIPAGEVWGGVPVHLIKKKDGDGGEQADEA
jgi:acetyltransferase-like isoleucine patch superfamily enzyme